MNSANFGFTIAFGWYVLSLMCLVLFSRRMFIDPLRSKIYAAAMENCSTLVALGVTFALIYW